MSNGIDTMAHDTAQTFKDIANADRLDAIADE